MERRALHLLSIILFINSITDLVAHLFVHSKYPTVCILPVAEHHRATTRKHNHTHIRVSQPHYEYHNFLNFFHHYDQIIPCDQNPDFTFIPFNLDYFDRLHVEDWYNFDRDLEQFAHSPENTNFVLDKSFTIFTHPSFIQSMGSLHPWSRNVHDIRLFRFDNDFTSNGRDIFVPHSIDRALHQPHAASNNSLADIVNSKKTYFFFIPIEEHSNQSSLSHRLANHFHNTPNTVTAKTNEKEYQHYLSSSEFCLIVGDETSSTSILYQAIFSHCIPVIFVSFPSQLPFFHVIDWSKFSIIAFKDYIHLPRRLDALKLDLERVRSHEEVLKEFKKHLFEAADYFDYSRIEFPNPYILSLLELNYQVTADENLLRQWAV